MRTQHGPTAAPTRATRDAARTTADSDAAVSNVAVCAPRPRAVASVRRGVSSLVCALALALVCASAQDAPRGEASDDGGAARRPEAARAPGTITGRVIADDGRPLAGVPVFARPPASRQARSALTGDDGRFRFDNLEPAAYTVSAFASGYVAAPRAPAERELRVYHRLGDDVQINLLRGGVITGTVTDARGTPVVAVRVRAVIVRTADGRVVEGAAVFNEQQTDDRGVYRIFGLAPGGYVVAAGGPGRFAGPLTTPYDKDAPTFYPSGTRDVASEVSVVAGQEAAGIDIRYRGARGHAVSGVVEGVTGAEGGTRVELAHASTGHVETGSVGFGIRPDRSFSFDGLSDGDYDLTAFYSTRDGDQMVSAPRRVTVRGADVTGIRLALAPLASVSGHLRVEPAAPKPDATSKPDGAGPACESGDVPVPPEAVVVLLRDEPETPKGQPRPRTPPRLDTSPDARGDFTINSLAPGRYRVNAVAPGPDWYVRSVTLPAQTATPRQPAPNTRRQTPASPAATNRGTTQGATQTAATPQRPAGGGATQPVESLTLRQGERLSGLAVVVAHGAASLRGRVVAAGEGSPATGDAAPAPSLPARLRVHLLPADAREDDPLRYAEVPADADGSFVFNNLAPGRYLLLARAPDTPPDAPLRPLAWDADARARLRRDAEAAKILVELQPCQRAADFTVRHAATRQ